ncbi:hypothetical protein RB601_000568 [Gaeumannomyces tritici]
MATRPGPPPTRTTPSLTRPSSKINVRDAPRGCSVQVARKRSQATMSQSSATLQTYGDCVTSLRTSLSFLESSVQTIDAGVADFPRLISVLKTVRHYELIPARTLAAAEASLRSEIGPFVGLLLDRADGHLARQARRIETLKAKAELQAGRLSHDDGGARKKQQQAAAAAADRKKQLKGEAALRARMVRQRKEALRYAVDRLETEVAQKERELRARLGE